MDSLSRRNFVGAMALGAGIGLTPAVGAAPSAASATNAATLKPVRARIGHEVQGLLTEQLAAYLASNPEQFWTEDRVTFHHIFLSATRRGNALEEDAKQLAAKLDRASTAVDTTAIGDPFLLGDEFREMSQSDVAHTFGEGFSEQLSAAEPGRWQGPISSSFGAHFIFVDERAKGRLPPLNTIRDAVQREWLNALRIEAEQKLYRALLERYQIVMEAATKGGGSETWR